MTDLDQKAAFVAACLAVLFLAAGLVVSLATGDFSHLVGALLGLILAVLAVAVVGGLFALADRLFPDTDAR